MFESKEFSAILNFRQRQQITDKIIKKTGYFDNSDICAGGAIRK